MVKEEEGEQRRDPERWQGSGEEEEGEEDEEEERRRVRQKVGWQRDVGAKMRKKRTREKRRLREKEERLPRRIWRRHRREKAAAAVAAGAAGAEASRTNDWGIRCPKQTAHRMDATAAPWDAGCGGRAAQRAWRSRRRGEMADDRRLEVDDAAAVAAAAAVVPVILRRMVFREMLGIGTECEPSACSGIRRSDCRGSRRSIFHLKKYQKKLSFYIKPTESRDLKAC